MASDNYYDGFDYHSSQNYLEIEYQIDLFEIRQYSKAKRQNKQKIRISSYPISRKSRTRKSQHPLVKLYDINNQDSIELQQKIYPYTRYLVKKKNKDDIIGTFECDRQLGTRRKPDGILRDFNTFRQHFYHRNHEEIKSSLKNQSDIEIINIRLAPIDKSVQNDFMARYRENNTHYPCLVYHGTKLDNIPSILDYGFLIPNEPHPTNKKAPTISTTNGSAYGKGVYCSETANYSVSYCHTTNTLLVCAALPERNEGGGIGRSHGNILVLSHVSDIIPLFLLDFRYTNEPTSNRPWFNKKYSIRSIVKQDPNKPLIISRKYLRKVLNCMKDQILNKRRYRGRRNNRHKIRNEEEYQRRVFEPIVPVCVESSLTKLE